MSPGTCSHDWLRRRRDQQRSSNSARSWASTDETCVSGSGQDIDGPGETERAAGLPRANRDRDSARIGVRCRVVRSCSYQVVVLDYDAADNSRVMS